MSESEEDEGQGSDGDGNSTDTTERDEVHALAEVYARTPLNAADKEIRLLHLWSEEVGGQVICSLSKASLAAKPEYQALSYAWGDPAVTTPIILSELDTSNENGVAIAQVRVTTNLEAALRVLRVESHSSVLWVDALCINQQDAAERSAQVQMMDQIYQSSIGTLVWLGDGGESGDAAMGLIGCIAQYGVLEANEVLEASGNREARDALPIVLHCAWWKRVWAVQEFVLSPTDPKFVCGRSYLSWSELERFHMNNQALVERTWHYPSGTDEVVDSARGANHNDIQLLQLLRNSPTKFRTLKGLLAVTSSHLASDPRDNIYALIGLVPEDGRNGLVPDYTLPVEKAYTTFVRSMLETHGSWEVICFSKPRIRNDLPSWVPDFSSTQETKRTNVMELIEPRNAHADIQREVAFSDDSKTLILAGLLFDDVEEVVHADAKEAQAYALASRLAQWPRPTNDAYTSLVQDTPVLDVLYANRCEVTTEKYDMFEVFLGHKHIPSEFQPDFSTGDLAADRRTQYLMPLLNDLAFALDGRRPFATHHGFMGMGPGDMQSGDQIIVAFGCGYPLVLRPTGGSFTLIGPSYIPAIIDGQWAKMNRRSETTFRVR